MSAVATLYADSSSNAKEHPKEVAPMGTFGFPRVAYTSPYLALGTALPISQRRRGQSLYGRLVDIPVGAEKKVVSWVYSEPRSWRMLEGLISISVPSHHLLLAVATTYVAS